MEEHRSEKRLHVDEIRSPTLCRSADGRGASDSQARIDSLEIRYVRVPEGSGENCHYKAARNDLRAFL